MARFLFFDDYLINILQKQEKPSGGAAVQTFGWVNGLAQAGHEIFILTGFDKNAEIKEEYKQLNILPLYDRTKGIRWIRWIYYRLPFLYNRVRAVKPDILYQSIPGWQSFFIGSICKLLDIKYVIRISNDNTIDNRTFINHSRIMGYMMELGMRQTYCILCQNDYQYNHVKNRFPDKTVLKIPNPILLEASDKVKSYEERGYIAWVGLFRYEKNLKQLYQIASGLPEEQFRIAGKELAKTDPETSYYLQRLRELPNVTFAGFLQRHEVQGFMSSAKFLLNTSHYEGFSNTFLEAMTVGTPILSSIHVNPDEIITTHNIGLTYRDHQDLVERYVSITPEAYREMSQNAVTYVLNNHNFKTLAQRLANLLSIN